MLVAGYKMIGRHLDKLRYALAAAMLTLKAAIGKTTLVRQVNWAGYFSLKRYSLSLVGKVRHWNCRQ